MCNEREQVMPPHCGNCIFLEWDTDISTCMHPCKVRMDGPERWATELNLAGVTAEEFAETLLSDAIDEQGWQIYDRVCDNWCARTCRGYPGRRDEERRVRGEARDEFIRLIKSLAPHATK